MIIMMVMINKAYSMEEGIRKKCVEGILAHHQERINHVCINHVCYATDRHTKEQNKWDCSMIWGERWKKGKKRTIGRGNSWTRKIGGRLICFVRDGVDEGGDTHHIHYRS